MDKTVGGKVFAPREIRQLAPSERAAADPDVFARVEGLGRIPYANLRRPKPLMDTGSQQLPPGQVCWLMPIQFCKELMAIRWTHVHGPELAPAPVPALLP